MIFAGVRSVWRQRGRPSLPAAAVALWMCLVLAAPAFAYLDPGTGSMLAQLILGGLAGLAVLLRVFWSRIKAFFDTRASKERAKQ